MKMIVRPAKGEDQSVLNERWPDHAFVIVGDVKEAMEHAADADAAFNVTSEEFVRAAPKLRWVQSMSAGVNNFPLDLMKERGVTLTNAAGVYGPNMADHTLAFMLMLTRRMDAIRRQTAEEGWPRRKTTPDPGELAGQTFLILGLGGIGLETARRAAGFGMRIIATRRHSDRPVPDFVESVHPPEAMHDLLPAADWLNVCVPLTPHTHDLIHDREFALMKDGVHLVCVTRGGIINTDALMRALDSGKVAGAGLDVTHPEPLPPDHPLWSYENVIITPHASGHAQAAFGRLQSLLEENITRFLEGEPLRNTVNLDLQY